MADFVVCEPSFKIVSIIELDDKTHQREKDEKRDAILKEAGLKIIRWRASNIPNAEKIQKDILSANT